VLRIVGLLKRVASRLSPVRKCRSQAPKARPLFVHKIVSIETCVCARQYHKR
jgi:hypothetical protein